MKDMENHVETAGQEQQAPRSSTSAESEIRHRCFMDGIDWQYHLSGDMYGTKVYCDAEDVRRENECARSGECGIVEVEIRLIRWVEPQNLRGRYEKLADVEERGVCERD